MEQDLIYKYRYSTEDLLDAKIIIYKHKNNEYTLIAKFVLFDKISLPKIKTLYKILTYEENEQHEDEFIIIRYKIKVLGINNPPPEKLFMYE